MTGLPCRAFVMDLFFALIRFALENAWSQIGRFYCVVVWSFSYGVFGNERHVGFFAQGATADHPL